MKFKKYLFVLIAVVLVLAQTLSFCVLAAGEREYSSSKNSGIRGEVCASIDGTGVADYYKGDSSIESLARMSSGALLSALRTLMTETHTYISNYDDCRDLADETACEGGNGKIVTLYTSYSASVSDYHNGSGWNREHVWPKSLGGFGNSLAGADMHHIRPTENNTNSQRGNKKYGNVESGSTSTGNISGLVGGEYNSQYFEPEDNVKGDVARICLYVYVRWGGEFAQSSKITNVFESVDVLLEWCMSDPVDTWEMGRNEVVAAKQGNRNVFIDYPELAWLLFDKSVPENLTTPSGFAKGGVDPVPCEHKNTELVGVLASTCIARGYSGDTVCADCKVLLKTGNETPLSTKHSLDEGVVIIEPTESSAGYKKHVCSVCEEVVMQEIAALGGKKNEGGCASSLGGSTLVISAFACICGLIGGYLLKKKGK